MRTGSTPNTRAMVGKAVAITVESRFCINNAQATITAVSRVRPLVAVARRMGGEGDRARGSNDMPAVSPLRGNTKSPAVYLACISRGGREPFTPRLTWRRWRPGRRSAPPEADSAEPEQSRAEQAQGHRFGNRAGKSREHHKRSAWRNQIDLSYRSVLATPK